MRPSALHARDELVADRDRQIDHPRAGGLGDRRRRSARCAARTSSRVRRTVDAQHQPLFDARLAGEHRLERRVQLGQRHLGQEAEAAEVDAEDRNARAGLAACSRPCRAACRRRRGRRPCRPSSTSASFSATRRSAADGISAAVADSKTASTPARAQPGARSRPDAASRPAGATWRRCRRARSAGTWLIDRYPTTEDTTRKATIEHETAKHAVVIQCSAMLCGLRVDRDRHLESQVQEELPVAGRAGDGRRRHARSARSRRPRPPR